MTVGYKLTYCNLFAYLGLCFSSVAFVVFLNSTQPFVLTEILGITKDISQKAGFLGFSDEVLSMILAPMWGTLSDKIGTRLVASFGLLITGLSFLIYTMVRNFIPDLVLRRLFFAVGASASLSMMTAILAEVSTMNLFNHNSDPIDAPLLPETNPTDSNGSGDEVRRSNGKIAGIVGTFSGLGALGAVFVLLPLPTTLDPEQSHPAESLKSTYHIVGGIAIAAAVVLFFSLHQSPYDNNATSLAHHVKNYVELLKQGIGATSDRQISLGYFGGFVGRASAVLTTLFIPLFVTKWFYDQGVCKVPASEIKIGCHDAYILSSIITGVVNLFMLIFAPIWGVFSDRYGRSRTIILSALSGLVGCVGFAMISNPHHWMIFVMASFLGVGSIGTMTSSMSLCTDVKREYSGSIAGVYSFFGGLGILLMTLIGGYLQDIFIGSPFLIQSLFYAGYLLWTLSS